MTNPVDKDSLPLNQPRRTPNHPTKSHIVKTKVDGKEKIIRFGQQGASTAGKPKEGESERMTAKRDSFKARHSANIAKGPSSAAYWANKVKWADGGSVRTHYAEGDSVSATPRQPILGKIADALKSAQEFTGKYQIDPRIPLIGGTGVDEMLSLPGAASLMDDISYQGPGALLRGGKTISTFKVDPRVLDLADVVSTAAPLAQLAGKVVSKGAMAAGRAGERMAEKYVPQIMERGGLGAEMLQGLAQGSRSQVVKPKGGNWLSGSIEEGLYPLKQHQNPRIATSQEEADDLIAKGFVREKLGGEGYYLPPNPINKWVDQKLGKYIKNEMGTPEDPVRALAERNILHVQADPNRSVFGYIPSERERAGFPKEGFAKTPLGKQWEDRADELISNKSAGMRLSKQNLIDNPWLAKVPPETSVYGLSGHYSNSEQARSLGFDHLIDELRNAVDPDTTLPANLRLKYSDLEKVTMPQAVERVSKINDWRAAQKVEADKLIANNAATVVHKEYPTVPGTDTPNKLGLRWVQFKPENVLPDDLPKGLTGKQEGKDYVIRNSKGQIVLVNDTKEYAIADLFENYPKYRPKNKALKEALKYEGDTMQHCVGSYCEDVATGSKKIFSLRDSKGMPHATIEVVPGDLLVTFNKLSKDEQAAVKKVAGAWASDEKLFDAMRQVVPEKANAPDRIVQIKGKQNSAPKKDYLPFVQDFVKGGTWEDVGDLRNTGLKPYKGNDGIKYVTPEEYEIELRKELGTTPPKGFAAGGSVAAYDPDEIDQIMNSLDEPTGYAEGGEVEDTLDTFVAPRYRKQRAKPSSKETKAAAAEAAQFAAEMLIPQTPMDAGLMLIPGGKIARKAGAALIGLDASDAEAGPLAKLLKAIKGSEDAVKEQKMLQGFYRGYAGENPDAAELFITPQKRVADFYAQKRSSQTGETPHAEMVLIDQLTGKQYGHSTLGTGANPPMMTMARKIKADDVKGRTQLYGGGGVVKRGLKALAEYYDNAIKGPQSEALKLAQERAALPVSKGGLGLPADNTAADRAKAMGFDTDVYHGSRQDFDKFKGDQPIFAAEDPDIAKLYGNAIYPLKLRGKVIEVSDLGKDGTSGRFSNNLARELNIPRKELEDLRMPRQQFNDSSFLDKLQFLLTKSFGDAPFSDIGEREMVNKLSKYGIDRLKVTDMSDMGGTQTQHMIPAGSDNIRSRFAAFDPFRKDVATATAMGVLAPDLLAKEEKSRKAKGGLVHMQKGGVIKAALEEVRNQMLRLKELRAQRIEQPENLDEYPTRFYRGMASMVKGGEDSPKYIDDITKEYLNSREPLSSLDSLVAPQRPSGALSDQKNMRRNNAWAASNPLTAASYATSPNSVMIPLELTQKPGAIFDAQGQRWDRFFSQTGKLSPMGNYVLRNEFKDALRDPEIKSILVKNIIDPGDSSSFYGLSKIYDMDINPEDLMSSNLLIKDPSVVKYRISGETPTLKESKVKKATGGSVSVYDPGQVDAIANQYM